MDAQKVFWSEFLEMYKSLPVLWKVKRKKTEAEKAAAYDILVNKLKEIDPEANKVKVIKKIHAFRSGYWRALKNNTERSGAGVDEVFPPMLWYFDLLHFLSDQEINSKPKSTRSGDSSVVSNTNNVVYGEKKNHVMACEQLKESNDTVLSKGRASRKQHNVFWSEFLEMYKSLPVLWKAKSENDCIQVETEAAYDKLVNKLKEIDPEANKEKVIKKIHTLRSNYRRELKKMKGRDDKSTLRYFNLLQFLTDQEEQSKAKSTMSEEESNDAISVLAEGWVSKYAELGNEQRILAKRIWSDVLFHGCMNRLTEKMVEDIHHVLKGTSNTSTPTPTSPPSSTPYYEEYSYSPQPQFTFVAYQQNDETLISPTTKNELYDELRQNPLTDLPSTSTTCSLPSRSLNTNKEAIQKSSLTPSNLKEYIASFSSDNQNVLNIAYDSKDNIEEEEYEDISYQVDDDDMMESIDQKDDSHDEINNKNLCQKPEKNNTSNAAKVAFNIFNRIQEDKLKSTTRRKYINWKKLDDDEKRELKRLQLRRDCVCDQCGRHFTNPSNFKLHLIRHSGIKNYECEVCNAKFYAAHILKRHSLMHTDNPPTFACKYCGKTFIYNNIRRTHERAHFRRYKCQYCEKSFFHQTDHKDHELVHTQIRKYHCETCDQHFLRGSHLKVHYRSKTHKKKEQEMK